MLKRIDEQRLIDAATDPAFLTASTAYWRRSTPTTPSRRSGRTRAGCQRDDLVAYFCAEFGMHESLPIYSGGLGILAGDHCKAASDFAAAVRGRRASSTGRATSPRPSTARATSAPSTTTRTSKTCRSSRCSAKDGAELTVDAHAARAQAFRARCGRRAVGHVCLYLLDTDLHENTERDRDIAHRLYGGDRTTRIEQEIVLGVGGVRALAALGIKPTVWHINEGHAAFLMLERMRELIAEGLALEAALEAVAANTVFTTHTPVPAGHDQFARRHDRALPREPAARELGVDAEKLAALARPPASGDDFNMTALAIRGSRHHNGVSRIHGGVSSRIC